MTTVTKMHNLFSMFIKPSKIMILFRVTAFSSAALTNQETNITAVKK